VNIVVLRVMLVLGLVLCSFLLGERAGRHKPITVEVVNGRPDWWGYNNQTRHLSVGLGSNTNPVNNSSYTFEP